MSKIREKYRSVKAAGIETVQEILEGELPDEGTA